jgi:hypothetical protein
MHRLSRPRVVLVTRKTPLALLLERFGTYEQARFYLSSRGQSSDWQEAVHERQERALTVVDRAIAAEQRRVRIDRDMLDRFLFAPDDLVLIVGQDGLVPNVAKYLDGQLTVGVNPAPENYDGVLCRHRPEAVADLLDWLGRADGRFAVERRTMARARREDGQCLLALNEVFVGHQTHQSARYAIAAGDRRERHSSSGVIASTGTGATGWARSIALQRGIDAALPLPVDPSLAWFVREPFPSVATGTELDFGVLGQAEALVLESEMGEGGVIFADGIESDRLDFLAGQRVEIGIAERALALVVPVDRDPG